MPIRINRPLSKYALLRKIDHFWIILKFMWRHMTEKFIFKDAKKGDFNGQMEFRKRSNIPKTTRKLLRFKSRELSRCLNTDF